MADALSVETRSRSRSKTPAIFSAENGDSRAKKIPTISLIEEEDDIIEVVPSSQQSQGRGKRVPRRNAKATVSDTSTDVSVEFAKNSQSVSKSTVVTTTVTEVVKRTNGSGETSTEQSSSTNTTKTNMNEGTEVPENQSIFNNIFNAIKTSTPILTNKRQKRIVESVTSTVNGADHPAYKEYKEAGEYWNKYPKTDYTYSELSPHRRQLSNGVVAMPNMSRRSLDKYKGRIEVMIQNNPAEESFLRRKFLSTSNSSFQKRSAELQYDSADEVDDVTEYRRLLQTRRKSSDSTNIVSRFFVSLISFFYSSYYSVKEKLFYRSSSRYSYTPIRKQKGMNG